MLERAIPNPTVRRIVLMAGALAATLLVTQFVLPGRGGARGTPAAVLFMGLIEGMLASLTAAALILIYRTTRIINFAQTAIGLTGATIVTSFVRFTAVPFVLVFLLGLLVSGLLGLAFDLVFGRRFFKAPRLVLTVVTIAAATFLGGVGAPLVAKLPFFPAQSSLSIAETIDRTGFLNRLPFPNLHFHVGALGLNFGFGEVFALEMSVIALIAVGSFFTLTRAGIAVRAMSENLERAGLLGISVGALSTTVWVIAGMLSGAREILAGLLTNPQAASGGGDLLVVLLPPLAAAVIAKMRDLPTAVVASVIIAVLTRAFGYGLQKDVALVQLGLFLTIAIGLLVQRDRGGRSERSEDSSWQATEEQRPIPRELLAITSLRTARYGFIAVAVAAIVIFPFVASTGTVNLGSVIFLKAIIALSLVVLVGWAGQVSLGQFAFAAFGGVVAAALTSRVGVPFWFAVPIAAALTGALAAAIGIPALRIRGLFLAVTTLAFAGAVHAVLFEPRYFGWLLPTKAIARPTLFLLDFDDERSMYFLSAAAMVATVLVVSNLRAGRWGRLLIGLRDNETNIQSFGITALRAKIVAFAVSGGLAGFAGAIFVHQQRGLSPQSFTAQASVDIFITTIIGGISSATGALLGAGYSNIAAFLVANPLVGAFLGPGTTLYLLYAAPGGLISLYSRLRDMVLRTIAFRRQLVVPSLFADYDPDDLARQLIPIAPASRTAGLAVIPVADRYSIHSELYVDEGESALDAVDATVHETREAALLGAAGRAAEEQEVGA